MKYTKLNKNWNAEPNSPEPNIIQTENRIELTFQLNPFIFEHIDEGDKGVLEFYNVYAYRLGQTNDEGYYLGQFRFSNDLLPWGEFYELTDSNWTNDFPDDKIILDKKIKKSLLRHFIFFLKDNTFECICSDFEFRFDRKNPLNIDEKYPEVCLEHFLAMFSINYNVPTIDNFKEFIELYIDMEGSEEFELLKDEIKTIKKNGDVDLFLKAANNHMIENFGKKQLDEMITTIEKYK
jgi:hypothetical protein